MAPVRLPSWLLRLAPAYARIRRFLPVLAVLGLLGQTFYMAFAGTDPDCPADKRIRGMDLVSYWVGGEIVAEGRGARLYVPVENKKRFAALYPPRPPHYPIGYPPPIYQFFAALQPLTYFPAIKVVLVLIALGHIVGAWWAVRAIPEINRWRTEALAAAISLPAAYSAVSTGQPGGIWVAAVGAAFLCRLRGRRVAAGALLGLLWAKPTLAVPSLLCFALAGEWGCVLGMLLGGLAVLGMSLAAGGIPAWTAYVDKLQHPDKFMTSFWIWWTRQMSLRSLLPKFGRDMAESKVLGSMGWAVGVALLAWVVATARRHLRGDAAPLAFAALWAATFLAAPHLLDYDLGVELPAMFGSAAWLLAGRARWPKVGWLCLFGAFAAPWFTALNMIVLLNLSVLALTAWTVWMILELRAISVTRVQTPEFATTP